MKIIREVKPEVMVTYDEIGGYGHPDHIQAHRVAMRAAELAMDKSFGEGEIWEISKSIGTQFRFQLLKKELVQ